MFTKPKIYSSNRLRDALAGDDGTKYATCAEAMVDEDVPNRVYGQVLPSGDVSSLGSLNGCGIVFDDTKNEYHITSAAAAVSEITSLRLVPAGTEIYAMVIVDSYLYAASYSPGVIWKIDLPAQAVVDSCPLEDTEYNIRALIYDSGTGALYAGCALSPGKVVKVNVASFTRVGAMALASGEDLISSLAAYDGMLYAGCETSPGKIARIDMDTFEQSGVTVILAAGENIVKSLVNSGSFLYCGLYTSAGKVARIDLTTFLQSGTTFTGAAGENYVNALATDGTYVYAGFGTTAGKSIRIEIASFTKSGATLTFAAGENDVRAIVLSYDGVAVYCGCNTSPGKVVRILVSTWAVVGTTTLSAGEDGVYCLATNATHTLCGHCLIPGKITRISRSTGLQDGTTIVLNSGELGVNSFVVSGWFAYCGLNTSPAKIVRVNLWTMQPSGTITLPTGVDVVKAMAIYQGYLYVGLYTTPGKVVRIDLNTWTISGSVMTFAVGENQVISMTVAGSYVYVGLNTAPGKIISINAVTWAKSGGTITFAAGEDSVRSMAATGGYLYCGMDTNPGKACRVNTGTWAIDGTTLTFAAGEIGLRSMLAYDGYLYVGIFGTGMPGMVSRINIGTWSIAGPTLTFGAGESWPTCFLVWDGYLLCGAERYLTRIKISTWEISGISIDISGSSGYGITGMYSQDASLWFGMYSSAAYYPGKVFRSRFSLYDALSVFERVQDSDVGGSFSVRAGLSCAQSAETRPVLYAADSHLSPRFTGLNNTETKIRVHAPNFLIDGGFESGAFLPNWSAGANWSIDSATELEGKYSAKWNVAADNNLVQFCYDRLKKGNTYTVLFKAKSLGANPTSGVIYAWGAQVGSDTLLDSDAAGYAPAITTTAAWFSFDIVCDFTTENWYLIFSTDITKIGAATGIIIDEIYFYEKVEVNSLWVSDHNWEGQAGIKVNAWRLSPLRSTAASDANNKVEIGSFTCGTSDKFVQALTSSYYPVMEIVLPAVSGWIPEAGEIYLGDYWQLPGYCKGPLDPYRTNADGLIEQTWKITNINPALRTTNIERLFEKLRAGEAVLVQHDTDAPLLVESPREAREAPYNPYKTDMTVKLLERI